VWRKKGQVHHRKVKRHENDENLFSRLKNKRGGELSRHEYIREEQRLKKHTLNKMAWIISVF